MQRSATVVHAAFASGMITLGALGLALRNFAIIWGPVPAWVPDPAVLAVVCALVALAAGFALLFPRLAAPAALVLFVYVALWVLLLKVPPVLRAPLTELTWLDCAMYGMLLAGAWTLLAALGGGSALGGEHGIRRARLLFGLALIPVGISHFVYVSLTVPLIPSWIPYPLGWAYATGAFHLAAALAILSGVLARRAAQLEATMLALFTILVWIPRVFAAPGLRGNWTEIWLSWALTAATAVVAAYTPGSEDPLPFGAGAVVP